MTVTAQYIAIALANTIVIWKVLVSRNTVLDVKERVYYSRSILVLTVAAMEVMYLGAATNVMGMVVVTIAEKKEQQQKPSMWIVKPA